jgi:hypothetical protein
MCCVKNIENLKQICIALETLYNTEVEDREVIKTKEEILADMATPNPTRLFYGIWTVGKGTTLTLELISEAGGVLMDITENSQIIELVNEVNAISGTQNVFFRGYEITLKNR